MMLILVGGFEEFSAPLDLTPVFREHQPVYIVRGLQVMSEKVNKELSVIGPFHFQVQQENVTVAVRPVQNRDCSSWIAMNTNEGEGHIQGHTS